MRHRGSRLLVHVAGIAAVVMLYWPLTAAGSRYREWFFRKRPERPPEPRRRELHHHPRRDLVGSNKSLVFSGRRGSRSATAFTSTT